MNLVWNLIARWTERSKRHEQARQHAYLAQSSDICDLERRMRELDRRQPLPSRSTGNTGA